MTNKILLLFVFLVVVMINSISGQYIKPNIVNFDQMVKQEASKRNLLFDYFVLFHERLLEILTIVRGNQTYTRRNLLDDMQKVYIRANEIVTREKTKL